jgi:hypothetical protein
MKRTQGQGPIPVHHRGTETRRTVKPFTADRRGLNQIQKNDSAASVLYQIKSLRSVSSVYISGKVFS